jgi:hypothetical protein
VQIRKKVTLPNVDNDEKEDFAKILDDPSYGRKRTHMNDNMAESKTHIFGTVGIGHIIGLEEAVLGKTLVHNTSVICHS